MKSSNNSDDVFSAILRQIKESNKTMVTVRDAITTLATDKQVTGTKEPELGEYKNKSTPRILDALGPHIPMLEPDEVKKGRTEVDALEDLIHEISTLHVKMGAFASWGVDKVGSTRVGGKVYDKARKAKQSVDPIVKQLSDALLVPLNKFKDAMDGAVIPQFKKMSKAIEDTTSYQYAKDKAQKVKRVANVVTKSVTDTLAPENDKNSPLTIVRQGGLGGMMRRGMLNADKDLPKTNKTSEIVGRFLGETLSKKVPIEEKRKYAREFLHKDMEHARAVNPDNAVREKILPHEERHIELLKKDVESGKVPTGKLSKEEFINKSKSVLIKSNNLRRLQERSPEEHLPYQKQLKEELGIKIDKVKKEPEEKVSAPKPNKKKFEVISPRQFAEELERKQSGVVSEPKIKRDIPLTTDTFENITVKTLSVESLVQSTPNVEPTQSVAPTESAGGAGGVGGASIGDLIPDVTTVEKTRGASKLGKVGSMLGKGARFIGKAALPIAAVSAGIDAIGGYNDAEETLGITNRKATFGEKLSSAAGGAISGATLGLLDKESASKGIASMFGAGPDVSKVASDNNGVAKSDITPIRSDSIISVPDKKQSELASAKAENDSLRQLDTEKKQENTNIITNNSTVISGSGGQQSQPMTVRSNYNAYERFVDRTFTTL